MAQKPFEPTTDTSGPFVPTEPRAEAYIEALLARHDEPALLDMEREARARRFPIVGRNVGAFLEVMALCIGARRVFEFGSGFGYSAFWFSRAVGAGGNVTCTDGSADNARSALAYLERVGRADRVAFHVGWAQQLFASIGGGESFDIIYNDVDKDGYPEVWQLARDRIRPGGLYIADNTLWSGRVTLDEVTEDVRPGFTEGIKTHNAMVAADERYDFFLNPIRDGVLVARRRG